MLIARLQFFMIRKKCYSECSLWVAWQRFRYLWKYHSEIEAIL
jgi:hypothetical protein